MRSQLKGIRLAWIRSFLVVIAITMLLVLLFFVWIRVKVTDEAIVSNYNSGVFMKDIVDERLDSIRNLSYQILYNDVSMKLLDANSEEEFKTSRAYDFVSNIRNFVISNNFIEDIFVYYPKYDFVVGKEGAYKSFSYYLLYHDRNPEGYKDWQSAMKNASNMMYFTGIDGKDLNLFFARYIRPDEKSEKECILICKIKKDSINNILGWSNTQYPNKLAAITNSGNQLYAYSGDPALLNMPLNAYKTGAGSSNNGYFYYKDYFIVVQPSKITGLNYILIRNRGNALAIQTSVTYILLFCLITCFIFGIILSIYLSNKNSKPLLSLLSRVKSDGDETKNEYEVISSKIDQLFLENETAIQQLEQQQKIISSSFVRAMLSSDYRNSAAVNAVVATYGINFENPYFCTFICEFRRKDTDTTEDFAAGRIDEFCEQQLCPDFDLYYTELPNRVVCVINFDCDSLANQSRIVTFGHNFEEFAKTEGWLSRSAAGGIYDSPAGAGVSYQEAKLLLEPGSVNAQSLQERNEIAPSNLFYDFQRMLFARNFSGAKQILPDLFTQYLSNVSQEAGVFRQNSIVNQVLEAALHTSGLEKKYDREPYIQRVLDIQSPEELEQALEQVLDELSELEHPKTDGDDSTAHKIKSIIDQTYSNPMLCLNSISDELGVSTSYISRAFKGKYSLGVVEYINQTRIEHAKELISKGDMSIKAVAIKVGFSSDVSFIRVFKKYEQITPGKYKQ